MIRSDDGIDGMKDATFPHSTMVSGKLHRYVAAAFASKSMAKMVLTRFHPIQDNARRKDWAATHLAIWSASRLPCRWGRCCEGSTEDHAPANHHRRISTRRRIAFYLSVCVSENQELPWPCCPRRSSDDLSEIFRWSRRAVLRVSAASIDS